MRSYAQTYEIVPDVIMESVNCKRCGDQVVLNINEELCRTCKYETEHVKHRPKKLEDELFSRRVLKRGK